jgi:hypothetical protein
MYTDGDTWAIGYDLNHALAAAYDCGSFGMPIAPQGVSHSGGVLAMQQLVLWPTLAVLAGAAVSVPAIQNSTIRNVLYWLVLSPIALGLVGVYCLTGIR